jgi:hypothetical protein
VGRAGRDYKGIRGSGALGTAALGAAEAVARAEALAPGEMRRVPFAGELIGAARVRARFAPLPLDAFDRVAGVLAADEQGAYFQLLRLAYGEGKNFCRAGKRDLLERLGLSERRLHRVLDALVKKRFLRPIHRDNRGTMWRVYLPAEAFGEPVGDDVLLGRAGPTDRGERPAPKLVALRERSPAAAPRATASRAQALARAASELARTCGVPLAAAEDEVAELAEDGATPRQIEACIRAAARRAGIEVAENGATA